MSATTWVTPAPSGFQICAPRYLAKRPVSAVPLQMTPSSLSKPDSRKPSAIKYNQLLRSSTSSAAKIRHPLIVALDETEGPHWLTAYCEEVAVRTDEMGVQQAYLRLHDVALVEIESGFDARDEYLEPAERYRVFWLNVGDLYELRV